MIPFGPELLLLTLFAVLIAPFVLLYKVIQMARDADEEEDSE